MCPKLLDLILTYRFRDPKLLDPILTYRFRVQGSGYLVPLGYFNWSPVLPKNIVKHLGA